MGRGDSIESMGYEFFAGSRASGKYQAVTEEFWEEYRRLIYQISAKYSRKFRCPDLEEDMAQEGFLGLLHAWQKFEPQRGIKFSTYLVPWVHAYLRRFLASNLHVVRRKHMVNGTHRRGTHLRRIPDASLDAHIGEGEDFNLHSVLTENGLLRPDGTEDPTGHKAPVDEVLARYEERAILRHVVSVANWTRRALPILENRILTDAPWTFQMLADAHGVSKEAIRLWESMTVVHLQWLVKAYVAGEDITKEPYCQNERRWRNRVSGKSKSMGHIGRKAWTR